MCECIFLPASLRVHGVRFAAGVLQLGFAVHVGAFQVCFRWGGGGYYGVVQGPETLNPKLYTLDPKPYKPYLGLGFRVSGFIAVIV